MRRGYAQWVIAITLGCVLAASGCTSKTDLQPNARCSDEVLAEMKRDAPRILALAPDDISSVDGRFYDNTDSLVYRAECYISDKEGNGFLTGRAEYRSGKQNYPSGSPEKFFEQHDLEGTRREITSGVDSVEGTSGRGGAGVWAPCSMQKSTGFSSGAMVATISAPSAPDADSVKQRQNAADLALSLLRYAVKHCDEPPALPKRVMVAR